MRQETELFKEKIEVSLDGRQVFYLFFGGAVIASLVFVLGVMVGKRVEARSHAAGASLASAATDPLAALDHVQLEHEAHPADVALGALDPVQGPGECITRLAECNQHKEYWFLQSRFSHGLVRFGQYHSLLAGFSGEDAGPGF